MKEIFKRHPRYRVAPEDFSSLPENLWIRCPRCQELLYSKEYEQSLAVCPKCKHHGPVTAERRLEVTLDPGSFAERDAGMSSVDPLDFRSLGEVYAEKLRQYVERTGRNEAFVYGTGTIDGQSLVLGVTEFKFCGGSMGSAFGEKVVRAFELGRREGLPVVLISNGGGARMQEGVISLMQMAKTVAAIDHYKSTSLPFISVLTDPCLGGMTASYAMLGDVNIAEPGAYIGFAGRRVIEQTMHQKLPQNAATAEFLLEHGMVDIVSPRAELRPLLGRLIALLVTANPARTRELVAHSA